MRTLIVVAVLFTPLPAAGSIDVAVSQYRAVRTPQPPAIDGVPDDAVWKLAPEISAFTQQEPDTGVPASERTVVRVLYDDDSIYFAVWLHDSQPITSKLARRDSSLASDWFAVYLDAQHDHRTARMFRVNPAGVQRDALLLESDAEDRSWDGVWYAAAAPASSGWTAELRIPYSQLRFPDRPSQVWGINFHREISRNNEYSRLVHVPRNESGFVGRFAHLTGIEGITPPRRIEVVPYGVSRKPVVQGGGAGDPLPEGGEVDLDGGIDAKYGITSNSTVSLTLNPDFGQVEADPAEVNLGAFELFLTEQRPFFLEGADLFQFGGGDLFYSRRIGRLPQGATREGTFTGKPDQTRIAAAAKLTGRTAGGWSFGVLDAFTREETARFTLGGQQGRATVEPPTNYFVARLARDSGHSGRLGMIFTSVHREVPSRLLLHDQAYSVGVDGYQFFGNRDYALRWSAFGSHVSGTTETIERTQRSASHSFQRPDAEHLRLDLHRRSLTGFGGSAAFEKATGRWRYLSVLRAYSPGLEVNDVGFRPRSDLITAALNTAYVDPEPRGNIRHREAGVTYVLQNNFGGERILERISTSAALVLSNYWRVSANARYEPRHLDDRATRGGPLIISSREQAFTFKLQTDRRRRLNSGIELSISEQELGGYAREAALELTYRPRPDLTVEIEPAWFRGRESLQHVRTVADAEAGHTYGARYIFAAIDRTEVDLTTRVDWALTRKLTFQLFLQPFVASGDYAGFGELARPASRDYLKYGEGGGSIQYQTATNEYTIDPDNGGAARPFSFRNPDFNVRSLRGNAVVRWEFRPGSALFVVWSQNRSALAATGEFEARRDIGAVFGLPADDVVLVKVSYWLGL